MKRPLRTKQAEARAERRRKFWRETVPIWLVATLVALACSINWAGLSMG